MTLYVEVSCFADMRINLAGRIASLRNVYGAKPFSNQITVANFRRLVGIA